jgi:hypothetical protein
MGAIGQKNRTTFEDVVTDNLELGIDRAHRHALVRALRHPDLSDRHRVVFAEIVMTVNRATGAAFPGRKYLAKRTGYTVSTIGKVIFDLVGWGFLAATKRAPPAGGRALAHYAIVRPSAGQLEAALTARARISRSSVGIDAAIKSGVNVGNGADINPRLNYSTKLAEIDVNPGVPADVNCGVPTVTYKDGTSFLKDPPTPYRGDGFVEDFERFWQAFPQGRKRGYHPAQEAFRTIVDGTHRTGLWATVPELIAAVERYRASNPDPQYVPLPKTWLNQGRWKDDAEATKARPRPPRVCQTDMQKTFNDSPPIERVRRELRALLRKEKFEAWFAGMVFDGFSGRALQVAVPNNFLKKHITANFEEPLRMACAREFAGLECVEIVVRGSQVKAA